MVGGAAKWLAALFAAIVGYSLPGFYVDHERALRQKAIRKRACRTRWICLPSASRRAADSDQAILEGGADETDIAHPLLARELKLVTTEIRAGKPRL